MAVTQSAMIRTMACWNRTWRGPPWAIQPAVLTKAKGSSRNQSAVAQEREVSPPQEYTSRCRPDGRASRPRQIPASLEPVTCRASGSSSHLGPARSRRPRAPRVR
ncbi:hypothetical protein GCM10020229_08740 [Kitasatospora albolonga]